MSIQSCKKCEESFEGESWQIHCRKCYLEINYPETYEKKYKMKDITCERCGTVFTDEPWKILCIGCYLKQKEEWKIEDLEEREQYK